MPQSRVSHHKLILNLLGELGYKFNRGGICAGFAMMSIQAFLSGDFQSFIDRIDFIAAEQNLSEKIQRLRNNFHDVNCSHHNKIMDLIAFLDGVVLYANPAKYTEVTHCNLSQATPENLAPFVSSIEIERRGSLKNIGDIPGLYLWDEFIDYIYALNEIITKHQQDIAITLTNTFHRISLCYDSQNCAWIVTDTAYWPPQICYHPNQLINAIAKSFSIKTAIALETKFYCTGEQEKNLRGIFRDLNKHPLFDKAHVITKEKADRKAQRGTTLAYIAAAHNRCDVIEELAAVNADLNQQDDRGSTPAFIAAQRDFSNVIKMLHAAGADLDLPNDNEETPAYVAAEKGHANVIAALGEASADLNRENYLGQTPAHAAAMGGHANVIGTLAKLGAELNLEDDYGFTPAHHAAKAGHVGVLAQKGINLTLLTRSGKSLMQIAEEYHQKEVVDFLDKRMREENNKRKYSFFLLSLSQDRFFSSDSDSDVYRSNKRIKV